MKKYPKSMILLSYTMIGFCEALLHMGVASALVVALATTVQGLCMIFFEQIQRSIYIRRIISSTISAIFLFWICHILNVPEGPYLLCWSLYIPIASGTVLVEGLVRFREKQGRKLILSAFCIALCIASGGIIATWIGGALGWL